MACCLDVLGDFRQIRRFRNHLSLCSIRKTVPAVLARFCITSWLYATYTNKLFAPEPRPNRGPASPRHQHKPTQQNRPFCAPQAKPAGGTFFPAAGGRPAPKAHLIFASCPASKQNRWCSCVAGLRLRRCLRQRMLAVRAFSGIFDKFGVFVNF